MSEAKDVTLTLKVVINKQKTKVLFAEVDNDFVDLLFSFLILPLGIIVQVLDKHYVDKTPHVIGSLNTLYHGLANLHTFKFQLYGRKPLHLSINSAYAFPFLNQKHSSDYISSLLDEAYFMVYRVFTEEKASFIICDNLRIVSNGNGSTLQTLNNLEVDMEDIDGAETTSVTFGLNEIMDFLRLLLTSRQPLTDVILARSEHESFELKVKSEPGTSLPHNEEGEATSIYNLKVKYQKSTKKLLVAQAGKDFVSYMATMLTIPLGLVDFHLGGNTCFNKLDNLYRSLVDLINHKYIQDTKKVMLMKPESHTNCEFLRMVVSDIINAEGSRMYMVTDDITVTRLCLSSTLSLLRGMKISASDVEEVELKIGLEEARNILKASLASTHALSDGLNNPKFMKLYEPKQVL